MVTKGELESELNDQLGTQMEWSKMKKDDLELLLELVESGALLEPLAREAAKNQGKEMLDDVADEWTPGDLLAKL